MISYIYLTLCFVLPCFAWQLFNKKKIKTTNHATRHIVWTVIFWLYCALALHEAGIGTLWDIIYYKEIMGGINLTPLSLNPRLTQLLNIFMFIPLGFLLPLIWDRFRSFWKAILTGFGFSLLIEFFQLFNHRISDVDDLIMNTVGTCIGYLIWVVFKLIFYRKRKTATEFSKREPIIYLLLGVMGIFLLFHWRIL